MWPQREGISPRLNLAFAASYDVALCKKGELLILKKYIPQLSTQTINRMGVLLALMILLSYVPSLNFGNVIQIGFGFIGSVFAGVLFGPVYGGILAMGNDLLTYFLNGSGFFFPGFTLSAGLGAAIYGLFLWRQPMSLKRIALAVLCVTLFVNLGLNSLWVKIMYDRAWSALMVGRLVKNMISFPINTGMIYLITNQPTVNQLIKKYRL